jgi:hypothetical protein
MHISHASISGVSWAALGQQVHVPTWQNDDRGLGQCLRRVDQHQSQDKRYVHVLHGDEMAKARAGALTALRT